MHGSENETYRPRILLVEDHPSERRIYSRALEQWGYVVTMAESAARARELIAGEQFDLVLADLSLETPVAGLDLVRWIEANPKTKGMLVVTMTGHDRIMGKLALSLEMGAVDCFPKMTPMVVLKAKLRRILEAAGKLQSPPQGTPRAEILHVEDDDQWADLVRQSLTERQVVVHRASSRKEMRRFLKHCDRVPGCIVMDIGLGDSDGLKLCDEIKTNPLLQRIPIVVLTALPDMELEGLHHKALHVIAKDLGAIDKFLCVIDAVLDQQERTRGVIEADDLKLDPRGRRIYHKKRELCVLDEREFFILRCLVERSPCTVPDELLRRECILRPEYRRDHCDDPKPRTVEVYVCKLRKSLNREVGSRIKRTVGEGYYYQGPHDGTPE